MHLLRWLKIDRFDRRTTKVQAVLIDEQVRTSLAEQVACPDCGRARAHKDAHPIVVRTLFGTLHLRSPRWHQCPCRPQPGLHVQPTGRGAARTHHP